MKNLILKLVLMIIVPVSISWNGNNEGIKLNGSQPQLSVDSKGIIRMAYGRHDSVFCTTSTDNGKSFSKPELVGQLLNMHLGMSRGPQLASSEHYSVITAMDKAGNISWFLLDHSKGKWVKKGFVNDKKGSAPEGLMGLAADDQDHFYAVWLDLRLNKNNNICFASLSAKDSKWSANKFIYQSPEGHTCECCKPNIAVKENHVVVMFRNWLKGSRDLYLTESTNGGKIFSAPEKLGIGTWKLNGCPMDGGGVTIDKHNQVLTTWQRQGVVYFCKPKEKEVAVNNGRLCSINVGSGKILCSYQINDQVRIKDITSGKDLLIGNGSFTKTAILPDNNIIAVWEEGNQIKYKELSMP